jgi:putative acetyltransferase
MAQAFPTPGLRPYLAADAPMLAAIFIASIAELTGDDYSEAQQTAWASAAADGEKFAARLASQLTLVGTAGGSPVAFVSLKDGGEIDMLYVHPAVARQDFATTLVDALEKLARARGVPKMTVDASDTAEPFFAQRGYSAERRNTVAVGDEWLATTTMRKQLIDQKPPDTPS